MHAGMRELRRGNEHKTSGGACGFPKPPSRDVACDVITARPSAGAISLTRVRRTRVQIKGLVYRRTSAREFPAVASSPIREVFRDNILFNPRNPVQTDERRAK